MWTQIIIPIVHFFNIFKEILVHNILGRKNIVKTLSALLERKYNNNV